MNKWIYAILAGLVFLSTVIVSMPLGFVMNRIGAGNFGVGWAQVEGSVFKGRINGVFTPSQAIGDIRLNLRPWSLFGGVVEYDFDWGSSGGRGSGVVGVSPNALRFDNVRFRHSLSAIEGMSSSIRMSGGDIRVTDGMVELDLSGCRQARGQIVSNALTKAAISYGKNFGPITGTLACDQGYFIAEMQSVSPAGDRIDISSRFGLLGDANVAVDVMTSDFEIIALLQRFGFELNDNVWTYQLSTQGLS
ncbi:MAG: hypothetical protein CME93_01970 [Hyphomonadaceae bacterium]|nr:hypothetical protein [Hyphomonadaceae bacterium]OUX95525.1 MAG: hypothetical protein CBB77_01705 [Hyphomonas sp. TMED17]